MPIENITNYTNDPKIWGPFYWYVFKSIAHNYPEHPNKETIIHTKGIFYGMQNALPCSDCRFHYREYIKRNPIDKALANKYLLIDWINTLENSIKKRKENDEKTEQQTTRPPVTRRTNVKLTPPPPAPKQTLARTGKPLILNSITANKTGKK